MSGEFTLESAEFHMVHVDPSQYSVVGTMIMPNKPGDNKAFGPYIIVTVAGCGRANGSRDSLLSLFNGIAPSSTCGGY